MGFFFLMQRQTTQIDKVAGLKNLSYCEKENRSC